MQLRVYPIFLMITVFGASLKAQESKQLLLGFEAGFCGLSSTIKNESIIRSKIYHYYDDYTSNEAYSTFTRFNLGVKSEYFLVKDYVGLNFGVRYSQFQCKIGRTALFEKNDEYFYFEIESDQNTNSYLRVKEITQTTHYVTVPLEVRFFIFKPRFFRLYPKIGGEFGYAISNNTSVDFSNDKMQTYEDAVADKVEKPDNYFTSVFGAFGINVGKVDKVKLNIELQFPVYATNSKSFGIVEPNAGYGLQLYVQFPIFKTKKDEK